MGSPIFNAFGQNDILSRFKQFQQTFNGNPQQEVQRLLDSGKISQEQYNNAVRQANQLARLLGIK